MGIAEEMQKTYEEEDRLREEYFAKCGPYTRDECQNCGRARVMIGNDGKRRCEKCFWCIEDVEYDSAMRCY